MNTVPSFTQKHATCTYLFNKTATLRSNNGTKAHSDHGLISINIAAPIQCNLVYLEKY